MAFYDISQMFKIRRLCTLYMDWYKMGKVSLEGLNDLRNQIGRPPVKGTYTRHLKINPEEFYSGRAMLLAQALSDPAELNVQNLLEKGYPPPIVRGRPYGGVNQPNHLAGHPGGSNRPDARGRGPDKSPRKRRSSWH